MRLLRRIGQRVTRPRVVVLAQVLAAGDEHVTANALLDQVTALHADVHRATVYRTLDGLTEAGVLRHVHLDRGLRAYHLAHDRAPADAHLHGQCTQCGRVVDLPADVLDAVTRRVADATGFVLDAGHVALSGRCADCADAAPHRH